MTNPIAEALERLDESYTVWVTPDDNIGEEYRKVTDELAALIRAARKPLLLNICRICNEPDHATDCALIALCNAINGGET